MLPRILSSREGKWARKLSAGMAASDAGNFADAVRLLEKALDIATEQGLSDEQVLHSYLSYGLALRDNEQLDRSEEVFHRAIRYCLLKGHGGSEVHMYLLAESGVVSFVKGKIRACKFALEKAVDIHRDRRIKLEPEFLAVLVTLTLCYVLEGQSGKAKESALKAYDQCCELLGPSDATTLQMKKLGDLASGAAALGDVLEACMMDPCASSQCEG